MFHNLLKSPIIDWFIALILFGLALWLRSIDLVHFVTVDEHVWVTRSGEFLHAILRKDWPGTYVWYTPAVTTAWIGSAGLASYYQLHESAIQKPFLEWLVSFRPNRIDLDVLWAMRWSMAVYTALMIVPIYGLARKLWSLPVAFLGTLFLLTEPHVLSISRIIGHDAPVTYSTIACLLALLYAKKLLDNGDEQEARGWRQKVISYRWFILSGVFAGLAVLSKVPALFLIPFVGFMAMVDVWQDRRKLKSWLWAFTIWFAVLWLTFVVIWPAAWANPIGRVWGLIDTTFRTSTGLEDPDLPHWAIPNLGPFYYLVHGAYKLSPFLMIGLILSGFGSWKILSRRPNPLRTLLKSELFWLLLFAILFAMSMTLGMKKSPRYILPAFPGLAFIAAWGWMEVPFRHSRLPSWWKPGITIVLSILAIVLALQYAPYYFTYFNPLLGGAYTAPKVVKIGWGEGLDEVGRWLNARPDSFAGRAGVQYKPTIHPFYQGAVSPPVSEELDYVVFYIESPPPPEILNYFEGQELLHRVELNGIEYARVYGGPGMQLAETDDQSGLPMAYRPYTIYAPIGKQLTLDLLWPSDLPMQLNGKSVNLVLQSADESITYKSTGEIKETSGGKVSTHTFNLSADMPRGSYNLLVDNKFIGKIKARLLDVPPDFDPLSAGMAGQLKLAGIRRWQENNYVLVDLAWQAWPQAHNNFTVFVQLLDQADQRVAGVDVAPALGFKNLDRKEVMLEHYGLPIPENLSPGTYHLLVGLYYFSGDQIINVGAVKLEEPVVIE